MPEHREKLRTTLLELESELREVDSLDTDARALLAEVAREIEVLLERTEPHPAPAPLQDRLLDSLEQFEVAHPTLAGIVRRLVDGLGQLGI
jgi:hypothetical protein